MDDIQVFEERQTRETASYSLPRDLIIAVNVYGASGGIKSKSEAVERLLRLGLEVAKAQEREAVTA